MTEPTQPDSGAAGSRSSGRFESFGRKLDEKFGSTVAPAIDNAEEELRLLITYLNDEVVPRVREHSATGLRAATSALRSVSDRFEAYASNLEKNRK